MTRLGIEQRVRERLADIEAAGLLRRMHAPSGVDLSSNDYLGLSQHPRLKQRMADAVMSLGCGATASRLLRGERQIFNLVERRFAEFKQTEAALLFASGYAANLGVLTSFPEPGDVVFSDELNHASLIDGLRLSRARRVVFPHCDVEALARLIETEGQPGRRFLVTESLFSMDGDRAPLEAYGQLCMASGTALIVDEAHAVGVYGPRGSGLIEASGIGGEVFLSVNTAGKALGVGGAFVAGPAWAIDYLIQRARTFVFSTAPVPAMAAALDAALDVVEEEPERRARLLRLVAFLRAEIANRRISIAPNDSQIIPVIIGDNERALDVAAKLNLEGFDVRAIRPPTVPRGTARLRVSVNATLDEETLGRFASALASAAGHVREVKAGK